MVDLETLLPIVFLSLAMSLCTTWAVRTAVKKERKRRYEEDVKKGMEARTKKSDRRAPEPPNNAAP